jgi:hypothetical protein
MPDDEVVVKRYFLLADSDSPKHPNKKSAYVVEKLHGSNVVARIRSVGMVSGYAPEEMLAIEADKLNFSMAGDWELTKGKRHKKIRLVQGTDYEED